MAFAGALSGVVLFAPNALAVVCPTSGFSADIPERCLDFRRQRNARIQLS